MVEAADHAPEGPRGRDDGVALAPEGVDLGRAGGLGEGDFAVAELAREGRVDGVGADAEGRLDLDGDVVPLRPLGRRGTLGEEKGLGEEEARIGEGEADAPAAGALGGHRHVVPVGGEVGLRLLRVVDDLAAEDVGAADVGAHEGASWAHGPRNDEGEVEDVTRAAEDSAPGRRRLLE